MAAAEVIKLIQAGIAHHQSERFAEAAACYQKVLQTDPGQWDAFHLLGLVAHQQGRHAEAAELIARALQLRPGEAGFWFNYGNVLAAAGRDADAVEAFRSATRLQPGFAQAWYSLCNALERLNRHAEVASAAESITRLQPANADDKLRLGIALYLVGHLGRAAAALQEAIALRPGFFQARHQLAVALMGLGRSAEAIGLFRELLAEGASEQARELHSNLLLTLQYSDAIPAAEIYQEHLRWAGSYADPLSPATAVAARSDEPLAGRRLRVGYVSADFRAHPVGRFMLPILQAHDRTRFEIFCYHNSELPDDLTTAIRGAAEHWRPIRSLCDDDAAQLIRDDRIDLLIDLGGHTSDNRLLVFARRPAPVSATYLGYPGTTGMAAVNYRITDARADPPGEADALSREKLLRLPRCFLCYEPPADSPDVAASPAVSSGHVTFGSFNQAGKISPATVSLWAKVLNEVPSSRLVLKANGLMDPRTRETLLADFQRFGVERGRVEMLPVEAQHRDHLGKYARLDVALDTFPYHGTTTTCDAFWMGVPTLTLAGTAHVSRVGVSLLTAAGLPEWVTYSPEDFVRAAARFAGNIGELSALRCTLRERLRGSQLMDVSGFICDLESAYLAMAYDRVEGAAGRTET